MSLVLSFSEFVDLFISYCDLFLPEPIECSAVLFSFCLDVMRLPYSFLSFGLDLSDLSIESPPAPSTLFNGNISEDCSVFGLSLSLIMLS